MVLRRSLLHFLLLIGYPNKRFMFHFISVSSHIILLAFPKICENTMKK